MGNEDKRALWQNIASMLGDNDKKMEMQGGAGMMSIVQWKAICKSYFNRYFKTQLIIVVPPENDKIMNTLSSVCSNSESRGFVFKNYDIAKHMEFLGYDNFRVKAGLGIVSKSISYIAYIEQKNIVFICEKVPNGNNIHQCLKNMAAMVKYFLTLYNSELQESGVKVVGLLIRKSTKEKLIFGTTKCRFCNLFILSYEEFESPTSFKDWFNIIETCKDWWDLTNPIIQNRLFDNIAAEILCFMSLQGKSLTNLPNDKSQQFKQAHLLFTPQQMDIFFSNDKRVIIQGSYGSGKSILGFKKLELILQSLRENEKVIYLNFENKSKLHFLMEEDLKRYGGIPSKSIKRINSIGEILKAPSQLIYVCHNSRGESLSTILQDTVSLNKNAFNTAKINYHLIIEDYDGETLTNNEAAKVTELVETTDLMKSNIILLAQTLTKKRCYMKGNSKYERKTCMFDYLKNTFKIVKLEEVLRCSKEICDVIKSTQNFIKNKKSVFQAEMDELIFEQQQKPKSNKDDVVSPSAQELNIASDEGLYSGMDLDQAFERLTHFRKSTTGKTKIVSTFGFLCDLRQGVDIEGLRPDLVEFSEDINSTSDMAVISLAIILKDVIDKNKATTILHMADEQPRILRRTIQLLPRVLNENFSYTQNVEVHLNKSNQSKRILCSNFRSVCGMEFDNVVIVLSQLEYYLKYYLPQAISRCTYDLTIVLLPEQKMSIMKSSFQKLKKVFSRTRNEENKETVANIMEELKRECLVKKVVVAECKACEKSSNCYSISNETKNSLTFDVHTHSDQYQEHLSYLADYKESEEQVRSTVGSAIADVE